MERAKRMFNLRKQTSGNPKPQTSGHSSAQTSGTRNEKSSSDYITPAAYSASHDHASSSPNYGYERSSPNYGYERSSPRTLHGPGITTYGAWSGISSSPPGISSSNYVHGPGSSSYFSGSDHSGILPDLIRHHERSDPLPQSSNKKWESPSLGLTDCFMGCAKAFDDMSE